MTELDFVTLVEKIIWPPSEFVHFLTYKEMNSFYFYVSLVFIERDSVSIINKLLPCSFGVICHLSHDHSYPMRQALAWSFRLSVTNGYFFHFWIIGPTVVTFSLMVLQTIPTLCRSTTLSLLSFDSSLVLPIVVKRLEWKESILWTGVRSEVSVTDWL